jgi:hypothetical protein
MSREGAFQLLSNPPQLIRGKGMTGHLSPGVAALDTMLSGDWEVLAGK